MLYFSKLRIIFITLISLLFIIFALSNLFNFDNKILNKKINLGLDLQGGSYLLLEIDNDPVIEQKLQNLTVTIRNYFKEKNVRITNFKLLNQTLLFSNSLLSLKILEEAKKIKNKEIKEIKVILNFEKYNTLFKRNLFFNFLRIH